MNYKHSSHNLGIINTPPRSNDTLIWVHTKFKQKIHPSLFEKYKKINVFTDVYIKYVYKKNIIFK